MTEVHVLRKQFRIWLILFIVGLILSGTTAFPLIWELEILNTLFGHGTFMEKLFAPLTEWITIVRTGLLEVRQEQPFVFYGTDWLAFGHFVIALVFWGPLKDPVRNKWVIDFGIIACIAVFPLAFICGPIRGIPFFWRLVDCSFGVFGAVPLLVCRHSIKKMESLEC